MKVASTVSNEISLGWNSHREEFHAYVKPNGTVEYLHNSEVVGRPCFAKALPQEIDEKEQLLKRGANRTYP